MSEIYWKNPQASFRAMCNYKKQDYIRVWLAIVKSKIALNNQIGQNTPFTTIIP
ncbi:MAG: hypothetical protein SAL07_05090 [Oscillatoria sp. PMC 1051.18]|nr:hypothetical protein [Oscillatoria sp. PMC 1050.18]MEC5029268.1 hypothetical protein [Oscillatoria sp. PMC 1051.18]